MLFYSFTNPNVIHAWNAYPLNIFEKITKICSFKPSATNREFIMIAHINCMEYENLRYSGNRFDFSEAILKKSPVVDRYCEDVEFKGVIFKKKNADIYITVISLFWMGHYILCRNVYFDV